MFGLHLDIGWGWVLILAAGFIGINLFAYFMARKNARFPKPNIVAISVSGVLKFNDKPGSVLQKFIVQIERIKKINPKAVIVRINTPGGAAGASHQMHSILKSLREKEKIPVIAMMEDMAASGGVYLAMGANKIVATPGTITGSIGVIIPHIDASSVINRLGIKVEHLKVGENKDMLSMSKPMTKAAKDIAESAIEDTYEAFCEVVASSRGLAVEEVKKFADGRILSAKQAKRVGLIDEVGGYETALKMAKDAGGIADGEERVYAMTPPIPLLERLGLAPGFSALSQQLENFSLDMELNDLPLWIYRK